MPTESSSTWPVMVASPARSAFSRRNASQSMPSASASSSIAASLAIALCGTPKPRNAPDGGQLVK